MRYFLFVNSSTESNYVFWSQTTSVRYENLTWDQAQFSFRFVNNIPVAVREDVWEPLKLGLISGYKNSIGIRISFQGIIHSCT